MVKLPIQLNTMVVSECWTFYRLAIIQTIDHYEKWLFSHLNLYMQEDAIVNFGDINHFYYLNYYNDILCQEEVDIYSVGTEEIVYFLKEELKKGYYIIIDANFSRFYESAGNELSIHETLIYGFDEERKTFFIPVLNNSTSFVEVEIPFHTMEQSYDDILKYYLKHPLEKMERSFKYNYPITRVKPINSFLLNDQIYGSIQKLENEAMGLCFEQIKLKQYKEPISKCRFYTGLSVLIGLQQAIERIIVGKQLYIEQQELLTKCFKKLDEHRKIFLLSMSNLVKKLNINEGHSCVLLYSNCEIEIHKCYLMALKYEMTHNIELLKRINVLLKSVYLIEKKVLQQFIEQCKASM